MNLLAHAILSPPNPGILAGNLVADWVKGKARHALPADLRAGMNLHRRIDAFTDTHAVVAGAGEILWEKWGRYSPVLLDIFFDHILAADWPRHSRVPLKTFTAGAYAALMAHCHHLPEPCTMAIRALTSDDWFASYATIGGIRLTLARMSTRLRHGIDLAPAADDLLAHRPAFGRAFDEFFPQLRRHVEPLPAGSVC